MPPALPPFYRCPLCRGPLQVALLTLGDGLINAAHHCPIHHFAYVWHPERAEYVLMAAESSARIFLEILALKRMAGEPIDVSPDGWIMATPPPEDDAKPPTS